MNKAELLEALQRQTKLRPTHVKRVVDAIFDPVDGDFATDQARRESDDCRIWNIRPAITQGPGCEQRFYRANGKSESAQTSGFSRWRQLQGRAQVTTDCGLWRSECV